MRVAGITIGLALLLLLAAGCAENRAIRTAQVVKLDDSSFREFYITGGNECLVFNESWPGSESWDVAPFDSPEPPDFLDAEYPSVTFSVSPKAKAEPLDFRSILPSMAKPAGSAVELAKAAVRDEGAYEPALLDDESMAALRAVSEGRIQVALELQPVYAVSERKLYRGEDVYPAFRIGTGGLTEYGTADFALTKRGFLVSWGRKLGGEVAFYYDGHVLKAAEASELENPLSFAEARQTCADTLAFFARLGRATALIGRDMADRVMAASKVLSEKKPDETEKRFLDYLGDLYEQVVLGEGLSPPRPWRDREPPGDSRVVTHQIGSTKVHFTDYTDWDWGIILEGDLFTASFGQRPSGVIMGYISDNHHSLYVLPYALTDVRLSPLDSTKLEKAVKTASQMAFDVLQSSGAKGKLNAECRDALAKLADRNIIVLSDSVVGTSFFEEVSAGGNQMMHFVSIPWNAPGFVYFRAKENAVTLDFMSPKIEFGPQKDIVYQVRLENGKLGLITSKEIEDARIAVDVKRATSSVARMIEERLLHVPEFARAIVHEFISEVSTAQEYDSVTVKPPGEIVELAVGRG
jgi:hypothetical protein